MGLRLNKRRVAVIRAADAAEQNANITKQPFTFDLIHIVNCVYIRKQGLIGYSMSRGRHYYPNFTGL